MHKHKQHKMCLHIFVFVLMHGLSAAGAAELR